VSHVLIHWGLDQCKNAAGTLLSPGNLLGWICTHPERPNERRDRLKFVVVVVVVMTSPSGAAYMGGQMSRRDEEFHQTHSPGTHL